MPSAVGSNHMRQQEEEALDLRGPLEEVREQLDEILDRERSTLSFKAEDDARMREMFLDSLPPDAPGMIRELSDYRFVDPQAQQMFDELMEHLREQVLGAYFRNMAEGMKNITPEQLAHFRDMLAELNQMIEQRARGDEYDFDGFMERYGDLFPDHPQEPGRAPGEHGASHGGHEPADGVALSRAARRAARDSPNR